MGDEPRRRRRVSRRARDSGSEEGCDYDDEDDRDNDNDEDDDNDDDDASWTRYERDANIFLHLRLVRCAMRVSICVPDQQRRLC